ncbi:MAG: MFS transporter [Bacteroidia bacterium]
MQNGFQPRDSAFAQGIFNSGASIGGLIAIPLIAYMTFVFSWQMIFISIGLLGMLWLIPWLYLVKAPPKDHPRLSKEEREYILSGQENQDLDGDGKYDDGYNPDTLTLLSHRQSWGIIIASAAIDPIWWLFVIWIPQYLFDAYGMDTAEIGKYGWVPCVGAIWSLVWRPSCQNRLKSGWNVNKTRKMVITLGCLIMLPALLALSNPGTPVMAVIIMAVILFGFQVAIGNVQTLPSDFFSGKTVGTLSGFAGMAAKFAAAGLTASIAWLTMGGNYTNAFILGSGLVLLALGSVWLLCGKIEPLSSKK